MTCLDTLYMDSVDKESKNRPADVDTLPFATVASSVRADMREGTLNKLSGFPPEQHVSNWTVYARIKSYA